MSADSCQVVENRQWLSAPESYTCTFNMQSYLFVYHEGTCTRVYQASCLVVNLPQINSIYAVIPYFIRVPYHLGTLLRVAYRLYSTERYHV